MRPTQLVRLCVALGLGFGPALISSGEPVAENQPDPNSEIAPYVTDAKVDAAKRVPEIVKLLRDKVKYIFVIFQENRSFDEEYGTLPGVHGLFSQPENKTPGFTQYIMNTDGSISTIQPFRLDQKWLPWDLDDVSHAHNAMVEKMNIVNGKPTMDKFALVEESLHYSAQFPTLAAKQYGELEMAYIDGNTIPFLWNYASKFVIFDNIYQTIIGPSSPNAIAMIAGQSGSTQWVKHPTTAALNVPALAALGTGVPVEGDPDPLWGSAKDPYLAQDGLPATGSTDPQINLTFASLPLSFTGSQMQSLAGYDVNPSADLADIQNDISYLTGTQQSVNWGWYQEGFSSADVGGVGAYIQHHNGPQYFGYVAGNTKINKHLHPVSQFFTDVSNQNLGSSGVYYIRGGFQNQLGLTPDNPDTAVQKAFVGDDDHPGYSDSQLSEALVATEINAIAASPYWDQCAIIITYDESEGDYDHVPPDIIAYDPNTLPLSRGPRIPLLVISPFANAHAVSHELGDHNSVIKFINLIFGLTALQDLPDEAAAQKLGIELYQQANLGPEDGPNTDVGDLTSAFSTSRLKGHKLLPASYAEIPASDITTLPHWGTDPLKTVLHITPTDSKRKNVVPSDFDPRPSSQPGFTPSQTPAATP
ncbi:MAG: phosphoesterase [Verrucomicrobia bacterium]|nr:phosphoesterase [Verrucomicrobiota bacterium]